MNIKKSVLVTLIATTSVLGLSSCGLMDTISVKEPEKLNTTQMLESQGFTKSTGFEDENQERATYTKDDGNTTVLITREKSPIESLIFSSTNAMKPDFMDSVQIIKALKEGSATPEDMTKVKNALIYVAGGYLGSGFASGLQESNVLPQNIQDKFADAKAHSETAKPAELDMTRANPASLDFDSERITASDPEYYSNLINF